MKKTLLILFVLFGLSSTAQTVSVTDWNNDNVLEYVKWSEEGYKLESGSILYGKFIATFFSYYPDGSVRTKAYFRDGKKHGLWKYFNERGDITHEIVYEDNRRVKASMTRYFE